MKKILSLAFLALTIATPALGWWGDRHAYKNPCCCQETRCAVVTNDCGCE